MLKAIIIDVDKSISLMDFSEKEDFQRKKEASILLENVEYYLLDEHLLPDVYFMGAWEFNKNTLSLSVNICKARKIKMNDIRRLRDERFKKIGFPFKLNNELEEYLIKEDDKATLKKLRDLPDEINLNNIEDLEELKNFIPDILKD